VSSAEEKRANFCKGLDGKPLFSALYGMYTVTLKELKSVQKVSAQAGQSGAVNKTSVESTAQDDDFQEVKARMHISNNTTQRAKKSTKIPISADVKLPLVVVLTRNFFAPLRTTDTDTETAGAENTLPKQDSLRQPSRPPPIVMTSTTNRIRLETTSKESTSSEIQDMEPVS
jgi:hypothetical protein